MPAGRPTKYDPSMLDKIVPIMAKGYSQEVCAHELGITFETWSQWKKKGKNPEFSDAVKQGIAASRQFWENLGIDGATGSPEFNATAWIFNMKNRFGWRDKHEFSGDKDNPLIPTLNVTIKRD